MWIMNNAFIRSSYLLGSEGMERLGNSKVAIFGIGGVGSYAAEALARTGIGSLILIDYDTIDVTNINRQIHATSKTVGLPKVDVMRDRLLEINPGLIIEAIQERYTKDTRQEFLDPSFDYIIDAIDMVSSKIDLVTSSLEMGIPIISSMGAGNKFDPTAFLVSDIYNTRVCPLARVMRNELRKRGVKALKVVYSAEEPIDVNLGDIDRRKAIPGSVSFVPSVAGLILAGEVIKDIALREEDM
ncbi:tRNA threonylcarbamoyladenosine dehydratase [Gudongella oleilytica]|uniref:tRNA threonylcarbamoyladenosine dehydratase n=1 Tax=Gudongella oleilytica TaxID=1582259 RepID=UPI002A3592D5|nr:tRNA threonylcarbamoyladenosine dehydratase [Gudongella oleilytica]